MKPVKRVSVDVEGCRIVCWRAGEAGETPLVCLHGAGMDHHMFDRQLEGLSSHAQLIAWDARGHGESGHLGALSLDRWAKDLVAVLDALHIERAVLVGQSLGGYIAQRVWLDAPERVAAMVLIGATPITQPYSRLEVWALQKTVSLLRVWPFAHFARTVGRAAAVTVDVQRYATESILRLGKQRFMAVWDGVATAISTAGIAEPPALPPTLLLQGQHDKTGTIARDMPRWAEREANARYHVIQGAGHNANQDQPGLINRLIREFLANDAYR